MESIAGTKKDLRYIALTEWIQKTCNTDTLAPLPGDASFRRYFRVHIPNHSFIAMDAPPPTENCRPFVAISKALRAMGLHTPEIFAADMEQGFLLLTDFGDATYLKSLNENNADELYRRALTALSVLQSCRQVPDATIPFFTHDFMWQEWLWHKEWFLQKLLQLNLAPAEKALDDCIESIIKICAQQPKVFMHRDYHSANLMVLDKRVGILDFQDAFLGPITYDLVSLLRDCYIDWPNEQVTEWVIDYWQQLTDLNVIKNVTQQEFLYWFDVMGLERHLKALFTFARKHVRDQQPHYLQFVPRTLNYLSQVSGRYREFKVLNDYVNDIMLPTFSTAKLICVP